MKWKFASLTSGDLIRVKRSFYYHLGIYIGNNKVIHFSGLKNDSINNPNEVEVRESSIEMFSNGAAIEKAYFSFKEKLIKRNNRDIVKYASSRLGEKGYDFIRNNCEDFAYSCVFRRKIKTQVDVLKDKVGKVIK